MNENRHPIDDLFRDGLNQHSMEPPMHVWERIDQTRTPVYKLANNFKQNARWYMSVAVGLVLLSSAAIMILKDGESQVTVLNQPAVEVPAQQDENPVVNPASPEVSTALSNTQTAVENTQPAQTQPVQAETHQTVTTTPIVTEPVAPVTPSLNPPAAGQQPEEPTTPEQTALVTPENPSENNDVIEAGVTEVKEQPEVNTEVETPEVADATEKPVTETADNNAAPAPAPEKEQKTAAPPVLPSPWFFEAVGSYDFVQRSFQHPDPNYVSARKANEKVGAAYTFQLRAGYKINPILSLRTGISFSQINEKLDFNKYTESTQIVDRQETGYILDPINGPQQITYTVRDTLHTSNSLNFNSNNRYTFIDIPVLMSYQFYGSNNWNFGVSGGPVFNLAFRQSGQILAPSTLDVISLNGSSNPFKGYAGINLMLNLNASYKLNKHFDLVFEPGMRFGVSSLTTSPNGMSQKYNSLNLFTGLRYNF